MIRLNELYPGDWVTGLIGEPIEVVRVQWELDDAVLLTFRTRRGDVQESLVFADQEDKLNRVTEGGATSRIEVRTWKIAAEALRLQHAALIDPMLAVSSSTLQPLPHQINAVYGEFLPRRPLRYLLADDPGAGKTIMCGLYVKELMLRGDLTRCLIVAPSGLVDQWANELYEKFGLVFTVLTRDLVATCVGSVFSEYPLLIARMDVLANNDELARELQEHEWDLVVVDEAHRMSATGTQPDSSRTNRYRLGELLAEVARNFLLLTATPHSGDPERFQAFLALLDRDRFGSHRVQDAARPGTDLMRRMLKEDLLTMEGRHLFTERRSQTISYELSALEARLYEEVSEYVSVEMNRAEAVLRGQTRRTVGFALMVLQRRLASSPEAILRSLQRRRERLRGRREELASGALGPQGNVPETKPDDADVATAEENEHSPVLDAATAAATLAELDTEIATLGRLIDLAAEVRASEADQKWLQLRSILSSEHAVRPDGSRRKFIVFTEHRDTLRYLRARIDELGRPGTVLEIHGGLDRQTRLRAQAQFVSDPLADILLATDAAGEGLNLQVANLMVNYDLPWNPNRLEQRFGRIHRIGQAEVCYLWNLVAANTREGDVYLRLLSKMEEQSLALQGKVFDVLGEAFGDTPLEGLLKEAIQYGDDPSVRDRLSRVVDEKVAKDIPELLAKRAEYKDVLERVDLASAQRRAEEGRRHALQPHFSGPWFISGLEALGGKVRSAGSGLHDVRFVPAAVKDVSREAGGALSNAYSAVSLGRHGGDATATATVGPGHRLFDATALAVTRHYEKEMLEVAVLVDPWSSSSRPRVLTMASCEVNDGSATPVSLARRFDFVEIDEQGHHDAGPAYLDYRAPDESELPAVEKVVSDLGGDSRILEWAKTWTMGQARKIRSDVEQSHGTAMMRKREEIEASLSQEIAYWEGIASGRSRPTVKPETAQRRAEQAQDRLELRRERFPAESSVVLKPPQLHGVALVVPAHLLGSPALQDIRHLSDTLERVRLAGLEADLAPDHSQLLRVSLPGTGRQWWLPLEETHQDAVHIRRTDVASALNLEEEFRVLLRAATGELRVSRLRLSGLRWDDLQQHAFSWSWAALWRAGEDLP
ncbi:helicase-related protein [Nocardioides ginkgobilobae]